MNNELVNKAQSLYDAKDFQGALMAFTQCLQDGAAPLAPGEAGRLYHQIGNCLVKLKDANEAIQALSAFEDRDFLVGLTKYLLERDH